MRVKLLFFVLGLLLPFVQGCSSGGERYLDNKRNHMMCQGKPQAYVDGYVDGCSSGKNMAGDRGYKYKRDKLRADRDALYAKGWYDGQIYCRNEALVEAQNSREQNESVLSSCAGPYRSRSSAAEEAEMRAIWEDLRK